MAQLNEMQSLVFEHPTTYPVATCDIFTIYELKDKIR